MATVDVENGERRRDEMRGGAGEGVDGDGSGVNEVESCVGVVDWVGG